MKFGEISNEVKNLDELILLDTRSCILRLECKCYVVVCRGEDEDLVCTFGTLSNRYTDRNSLDEIDVETRVAGDFQIAPLAPTLRKKSILDNHVDFATGRLRACWSQYTDEISRNFALK